MGSSRLASSPVVLILLLSVDTEWGIIDLIMYTIVSVSYLLFVTLASYESLS